MYEIPVIFKPVNMEKFFIFNPLVPGVTKNTHILKQTWNRKLQVYLSKYNLLVETRN